MDYQYENLDDERFQEFCSCLISKEFPNVQSYPVGQPDGGRDTIVYLLDTPKKDFIVFQVKYVRNANQERDLHKWLIDVLEGEAKKVDELIPKGAKKYYLLTNVRGTAHLDSGSKDKVNAIFEDHIKIPAICWWRDDLSRLFEKDPIFKWSFPEILNGQDILNSVLFENLQENKERRASVIRAYLTDQFEIDSEVKFKQIDLQNRLLSLFTDVPLKIKKLNQKNKSLKRTLNSVFNQQKRFHSEEIYFMEENLCMGAAEFLLHSKTQNEIERVLLEGGPGQGKSTISQYVCQVHRIRLLDKNLDIKLLPHSIKNTPIRLPFKVDLRDIAAWVEKKNPYQGHVPQESFDSTWKNSLESFLTSHIYYHSKIDGFTISDFIAICKYSPILFVFDGFDEIANIKSRSDIIEFIDKGITRISANTKSVQAIITSRPAAFSDSVGFSTDNYPHFELTDITPNIINEYVEKWVKASKLGSRDASELKKLVNEKLEMPHLKELAKSPMQLAIFISLLRTKGQSLPNKRTALYDNYINLYFDRESEKNNLIRDKRDLIIDIHQYLAWLLHSEAELYKNSGSINFDQLIIRLKEYLKNEGHDPSIADQLFDVMKERVCALVSRVQGTFEFEVQPLREYFCAKYLYTTAQNSTVASVKPGTKPDRFNAILRNFYWQNVVRFFAGCADAGELDMILQELRELQSDELLKFTHYPRIITSQILSDYVFTQKPKKMIDVVKIIVDGINIGNIINQNEETTYSERLLLPNECGRTEVINECFQQLAAFPSNDYALELIGVINNNPLNNLEIWQFYLAKITDENLITKWLEHAYRLQLIHKIDDSILLDLLRQSKKQNLIKRIQIIINGNRIELLNHDVEIKKAALNYILSGEIVSFPRKKSDASFNFFIILFPHILINALAHGSSNISLIEFINRMLSRQSTTSLLDFKINDEIDQLIRNFATKIEPALVDSASTLGNGLDQCDKIIEAGRDVFGDNWIFYVAATIASGIKSKNETIKEYSELNDTTISLCKRARFARLRSGNIKYWTSQFEQAQDLKFPLLLFFSWATPKAIIQMLPLIIKIIKQLDSSEFSILLEGISVTTRNSIFDDTQQKTIELELKNIIDIDEIKYILSLRFRKDQTGKFIYENIKNKQNILKQITEEKFQYLLRIFMRTPKNIDVLHEIKALYPTVSQYYEISNHMHQNFDHIKIPYLTAKQIMGNYKDYPKILGSLAEKACRFYANEHLIPVGKIAADGKWFD